MLSFVRAVPARRRPVTLADRLLGVSRRRRQAAYAAFATGYSLLRPALRRLAVAGTTFVLLAAVVILDIAF